MEPAGAGCVCACAGAGRRASCAFPRAGCPCAVLLDEGNTTNYSELLADTTGACYDNALLRASPGVPLACLPGGAHAYVFQPRLTDELADLERLLTAVTTRAGPTTAVVDEWARTLRHKFATQVAFRLWSDHKPLCIKLQCRARGAEEEAEQAEAEDDEEKEDATSSSSEEAAPAEEDDSDGGSAGSAAV
jgi:hypothetical protein